jgi:hypothetical protein
MQRPMALPEAEGAAQRQVKHLDQRLLIDAEHHGGGRRMEIGADDVADLGGELRNIEQLEGPNTVRRQAVACQMRLT